MITKLFSNEKIAETSSKGNQEKWIDGELWYKADQFGYEALTEVLTSKVLEKSNIEKETPFEFVRYEMQKVNIHGAERTACISKNFLKNGESIITLSALLSKNLKTPLRAKLGSLNSDKKRLMYLVEATKEYTGLLDFDKYLTLLFEVDSLILNDDRHLNNIAVIEKKGKFSYCPIFDNGAGLLSNMQFYRTDIAPEALIKNPVASPFNMTFNREVKTMQSLYGSVLKLPPFSSEIIGDMLSPLLEYYPKRDRGVIAQRVSTTIITRQKLTYTGV
ncbi:MAG: hypothetical protein IKI34_03305 [Eubacterium sp.]|nr:hypothetical protein [Eubacterium sp.]